MLNKQLPKVRESGYFLVKSAACLSTFLILGANPGLASVSLSLEKPAPKAPAPHAKLALAKPLSLAEAGKAATKPTESKDNGAFAADLPPVSDAEHNRNKTLDMSKLRLQRAVHMSAFGPIRLEVQYEQPITLSQALEYAYENSLPIKISRENMHYQGWQLGSQLASALPSFSMSYNLTKVNILNENITSEARVFQPRINYPVFQGGSVVYSIMAQICRYKGWQYAYKGSVNDALLDVYQKYTNLVLNRVLLQIRAKAVEVSEAQLATNNALLKHGTGTRFAVMQSQTQLASDRQALIQQEVAARQASLALNFALNFPMAVNLVPDDQTITEDPIFQANLGIEQLAGEAVKSRPELREFELFKFAAARNVQVATAPLYPTASFFQLYSLSDTSVFDHGGGAAGGTAGAGVFGGLFKTYQEGFALVWSLNGLGMVNLANICGAQALNRQALIQANQELQTILEQVRTSYLNWRVAREQIDNAAYGVDSSFEELRLAIIRLRAGVGTNLEVIQAQRDYINALTTQAQAIMGSNQSQAQLLHDIGVISVKNLLYGYKPQGQ